MDPRDILHPGCPANPNYIGDIEAAIDTYIEYGELPCNEDAREIAGWWQAEDGDGWHFAVFATSGVITHGLLPAIDRTIADPANCEHVDELNALKDHIESYFVTSDVA